MILNQSDNEINLVLSPGKEMVVPCRGLFASFPKLRVTKVITGDKHTSTEFWPNAGSLPSTRHSKTIRFINLDWNGVKAKIEYDDSSKLIKVLEGNVDSVVIQIT